MSENRKYLRVTPGKKYPIRLDINGNNFIEILRAKDISLGGIGIEVAHQFTNCEIDGNVELIIRLPQPVGQHIHARGKILHVNNNLFGINFSNLPKNSQQKLREYILYRVQQNEEESWFTCFMFKLGFRN